MAITNKLSHRLYEALGDEAANEMVDWMQRVDAQRAELRELNELNFSRLDARIDALAAALAKTGADLRREMEAGFARLEIKLEQRTVDIMKWSFVFWVGSVVTLVGALATLPWLLP